MKVVDNTARLDNSSNNSQPSCDIDSFDFYFHLSHRYRRMMNTAQLQWAWETGGSVEIELAKGETPASLNGWRIGFMQVQHIMELEFQFAGATPSDGSVYLHAGSHPLLRQRTDFDGDIMNNRPWTAPPSTPPAYMAATGRLYSNTTGDHPCVHGHSVVVNMATSTKRKQVLNYLFRACDHREFWTCLCTQDPGGVIRCHGWFWWQLNYEAQFQWVGSTPRVCLPKYIRPNIPPNLRQGEPSNAHIRDLVLHPPPRPWANDKMKTVIQLVEQSQDPTIREDIAVRDPQVPSNFHN